MDRKRSWRIVIVIAFMVIGGLLMVHRAGRRTYQDYVALDGKGPPILIVPRSEGPDDVLLYRVGRNGVICYDVFSSRELHDYLSPKNGHLVTVEYNTFSDFGKVRAYNVHSVDGKVFANGLAGGAGVAKEGSGSASGDDCW